MIFDFGENVYMNIKHITYKFKFYFIDFTHYSVLKDRDTQCSHANKILFYLNENRKNFENNDKFWKQS